MLYWKRIDMNNAQAKLTIPNLLILCGSVILGGAVLCLLIFFVSIGGFETIFNNGNKETKREEMSITYDGFTFNLSPNFGKTVRNIAKYRKAYNVQDFTDSKTTLDIEKLLKESYDYDTTRIAFFDNKNQPSSLRAENTDKNEVHENDYTVGDTDTLSVSFYIEDGKTAKIDNKTIQGGKTTEDDLLKAFENSKIQDEKNETNDFHRHFIVAKHKGWYIYITPNDDNTINIAIRSKAEQRF